MYTTWKSTVSRAYKWICKEESLRFFLKRFETVKIIYKNIIQKQRERHFGKWKSYVGLQRPKSHFNSKC